jgi:hypothetical protein
MPGQPDRHVALKRRETAELIAEELRRLDPDEVYSATLRYGVDRLNPSADEAAPQEPETAPEAAEAPEADGEARIPAKKVANRRRSTK